MRAPRRWNVRQRGAVGAFVLLAACMAGCTQRGAQMEPAIRAVLAAQDAAWNRGDIDGFMSHYLHSDELTFSAGGQTQNGWQATIDRYRSRYPTPDRMGKLDFSELRITSLGDSAALVLGRWHLTRSPDSVGGNFTLVMRKIDGRWVIIHDHTSIAPTDAAAGT